MKIEKKGLNPSCGSGQSQPNWHILATNPDEVT